MHRRFYSLAALAPLFSLAYLLVSIALGPAALADPCPSPGSGGC